MRPDFEKLRLERLTALEKSEPETFKIYAAREQMPLLKDWPLPAMREALARQLAGPLTEGVSIEDIEVPSGDGYPIATRIYTPDNAGEKPGIYIHYHGGGYVALGGVGTLDVPNSRIAKQLGCILVAADFRIPPEHKFPAAVEDAWAVAKWVGENAADRGWNKDKIGVGGGCTGGNIASVIALMARDAGAPNIAAQFCIVTLFDARCDTRSQIEFANYLLRHQDNQWVVEQYLDYPEQKWDWRVTPLLVKSVKGVAPALIITGEYDVLRDEGEQYANRLRDAGVEVDYRCMTAQGHVFAKAAKDRAESLMYEFLRKHIT